MSSEQLRKEIKDLAYAYDLAQCEEDAEKDIESILWDKVDNWEVVSVDMDTFSCPQFFLEANCEGYHYEAWFEFDVNIKDEITDFRYGVTRIPLEVKKERLDW